MDRAVPIPLDRASELWTIRSRLILHYVKLCGPHGSKLSHKLTNIEELLPFQLQKALNTMKNMNKLFFPEVKFFLSHFLIWL